MITVPKPNTQPTQDSVYEAARDKKYIVTEIIKPMKINLHDLSHAENAEETSTNKLHEEYAFNTDVTSDEGESCILKEMMSSEVAKFWKLNVTIKVKTFLYQKEVWTPDALPKTLLEIWLISPLLPVGILLG